jgi:hypothetical protein
VIFFGITGSISADWGDWITPKAVAATGYAGACVFGYFKWYRPYKQELAQANCKKEEQGRWPAFQLTDIQNSFLNGTVKKNFVSLEEGSEIGTVSFGEKYDINTEADTFKHDLQHNQDYVYQGKYTCGILKMHTVEKCDVDKKKMTDKETMTDIAMTTSISSYSMQPWLKKIGYAYGAAGLGVLAFCGLTK